MCNDGKTLYTLSLQKVLFVSELTKNLLSVPAMVENGADVFRRREMVGVKQQTDFYNWLDVK